MLLTGRAMSLEQIATALGPGTTRVHALIAALEGEGLLSVSLQSGRAVYRATLAGLSALEARGVRPTAAGPLAILFTDMVDSTRLIMMLGEQRAHDLRRRHFSVLREAISTHGGYEVKSLGDGLMVAFDDAGAALACARAMQAAVSRNGGRVGLRIGIDFGEPLREGDDFFGTPVVIARRLCDSARGGQVLVSDRVREQLRDQSLFELLGFADLKGLDEPVAISELVGSRFGGPIALARSAGG